MYYTCEARSPGSLFPATKYHSYSEVAHQVQPYIYVMRIRKMLISYVRLDHTLYLINYGSSYDWRYHE